MNQRIFIRRTLYRLKRNYGVPATLYHVIAQDVNVESGRGTTTITKYTIRKAIILPVDVERQLIIQSALFRTSSAGITPSGHDILDRMVIIDSTDLPADFEFGLNDYLLIRDARWNIRISVMLEDQLGIALRVSTMKGQPRNKIFDETATNELIFFQDAPVAVV